MIVSKNWLSKTGWAISAFVTEFAIMAFLATALLFFGLTAMGVVERYRCLEKHPSDTIVTPQICSEVSTSSGYSSRMCTDGGASSCPEVFQWTKTFINRMKE